MAAELELPEGLSQLSPEVANRVIDVAAAHQLHLQAMDRAEITLARRGQAIAAALSVFFGAIATWLTLANHDAVGGTIAGTTIVALASAFILRRHRTP
jgi:uncharacterized membrane protein